jgi:Ca-activated chloride channel family protein
MALNWPYALAALLAFPLLLAFRWWMRRRRRREAVRLPSVALIKAALPGRSLWRRRIPLWLFAIGLVILATGAARPQAKVVVPSDTSAILLVMDVSGSMCSTDVAPNRLSAAQAAAGDFIKAQEDGMRIGLVAFSGIAALTVKPTTDKEALLKAIGELRTGRGTAIGLGILTAIDAISEINPAVPPTGVDLPATNTAPAPGADVAYEPDTIVVLTDGANTQGVDPVTAAKQAAARKLRVYTIGFGTTTPAPMVCTADQISGSMPFSGDRSRFSGGGGRRMLQIDEAALTQVATSTGGKYYQAKDAKELSGAFKDLPASIVLQRKNVEITMWFALIGALFVVVAMGLSQWWNRSTTMLVKKPDPARTQ